MGEKEPKRNWFPKLDPWSIYFGHSLAEPNRQIQPTISTISNYQLLIAANKSNYRLYGVDHYHHRLLLPDACFYHSRVGACLLRLKLNIRPCSIFDLKDSAFLISGIAQVDKSITCRPPFEVEILVLCSPLIQPVSMKFSAQNTTATQHYLSTTCSTSQCQAYEQGNAIPFPVISREPTTSLTCSSCQLTWPDLGAEYVSMLTLERARCTNTKFLALVLFTL